MDCLSRAGKDATTDRLLLPVVFEPNEEELHGLNMKNAIEAHLKWEKRIENTLAGTSAEYLEVSRVAVDCYCTLGQWLHSEGGLPYSDLAEYKELLKNHAEFHLTAGSILCDAHEGKAAVVQEKLRTIFRKKSDRVQLDLVRLYVKARE